MTDNISLRDLGLALDKAQSDYARLQCLMSAEADIKRLTTAYEKAVAAGAKEDAARLKAVAAEEKAAQEARFAGLRDLSIEERVDIKNPHVLKNAYIISYSHPVWMSDLNETAPTPKTVTGFAKLDANVLAWIIERHPHKVPASIMALAPDNVEAAFDRYFIALRRGYLAS